MCVRAYVRALLACCWFAVSVAVLMSWQLAIWGEGQGGWLGCACCVGLVDWDGMGTGAEGEGGGENEGADGVCSW
ncbi:hypothetical protein BKA80DRAFT_271662 [Phyllosticta citrichinensis]